MSDEVEEAGGTRQDGEGGGRRTIQELLESMSQLQAQLKQRRATPLPPVAKDAPLSEVLQGIRRTLHQLHKPEPKESPSREAEAESAETDAFIEHLRCDSLLVARHARWW